MQAPAAGDSLIGGTLGGKYRVLQQIGRGGMGVVYEAEHLGLGKRVAVKLMLEKYTDNTEAVARFHREALAAGRIGNPHIIEIFDIGTAPDGRSYVVMELLNGFPLSKVLEMGGQMPPWRAVQIMRQVLRAVGAAHAKGIIHRDLKPDNIFIIHQGGDHDFVKLLDFGISKVVSVDEQAPITTLTTTGVVMGTPLYMAPEQALGEPIDRYADIYACGVILYEMLAGRRPFDGPTYAALVAKVLTSPPQPLGELRPGLPAALVRAVHRALEKEPRDRFDSAEQFAAALPSAGSPASLELVGTVDGGVSAAMSAPPAPGRLRNVKIAAVAFTLAAAATAAALVLLDEGPPASAQTAAAPPAAPGGSPAPSTSPEARKADPAPRPLPATGTLDVRSIPSGAAVIIDGREQGKTPLEVTLEEGRHRVQIELPGHVALTAEADVHASQRSSILVPLAAAPPPKGAARTVKPRSAPADGARPKPAPAPGSSEPPRTPSPPTPTPTPPATAAPTAVPTPTPAPTDDTKRPGPAAKPNPYAK
ncbi:MAG TPA: serine/threonine-protein kinase [Kofleriaceae bacterium]|nr:serine/threonine-protein kinase [Kofleriaceae bacterium]